MMNTIKVIIFIIIALLILTLLPLLSLFCHSCTIISEDRIIDSLDYNGINIYAKEICDPTAFGSCMLSIERCKSKYIGSDDCNVILEAGMILGDLKLEILTDSVLLIKCFMGDQRMIEPYIVTPIYDIVKPPFIRDRFAYRDMKKLDFIENDRHLMEIYHSGKDPKDLLFHYLRKEDSSYHRNIFISDVEQYDYSFIADDIIELNISWNGVKNPTKIFTRFWHESGKQIEFYYDKLPDMILRD